MPLRMLVVLVFAGLCCSSILHADDLPNVGRRDGVKPRNVVFILTDDHRYDAMGFMGHPFLETPHLDSLASNGVHLKNAFVTTSLCSPSRASILTGLYTHKHRVIDNNRLVPEGTIFFPQYLQRAEPRHLVMVPTTVLRLLLLTHRRPKTEPFRLALILCDRQPIRELRSRRRLIDIC